MARSYSRREALRLSTGLGVFAAGGWLGLACGGDSGSRAVATPPATAPRGDPPSDARSGRLRLGLVASDGVVIQPLSRFEGLLTYSRLIAVDPRDALVHADLAESFEVVEPLEVRFELRPGAFLHPDVDDLAVPINAEAIKRDFERRAAEGTYLFSEVIDQIEAPDALTLTLRLRAPFSQLFELLSAPEAGIRGESRYAAFTEPVGSGPFVPAGQDSTGHVLLANPRFHDAGYPRLEQVNVLHFPDEAGLDAAFLGSEIDVRHHPNAASLEAALDRPGTQQVTRAARSLRGLGLSLLPSKGGVPTEHVEAFQDERVRRAVSISLDREALAAIDDSMVAGPVGAAFRADSLSATELAAHPLYRHDPAEAAKLLQAVGSEPVAFRILATDSSGPREYTALIQHQLREVGFEAELRLEAHASWQTAFFAGNFEATLFELKGLDTPGLGLRLHTTGGLDGRFSLWGYSNPVFDAAVNTALSQLVPAYRANATRQAQRVLLEQAPGMFPLVTPVETASIGPRVAGYAFDAFDFNPGWLAAEWERPA